MSNGLNKFMCIGNVGQEPTLRYTAQGTATCSFSVAINRRWTTPDNQQRDETEWVNVVTWEKLAENMNQMIRKGRKVYIEGRLQTRSWESQDGQKRSKSEVVAQVVLLLDPRPAGEGRDDEGAYAPPDQAPAWDADLPF